MSYTAHRDQLTVEVFSPFHNRIWKITPRQYQLMCRIFSGRRFTLAELGAEIGYSRSGLQAALQALVTGGLVVVRTRLGRFGWTFAKVRPGVVATKVVDRIRDVISNVLQLGTSSSSSSSKNGSLMEDIQYDVFFEGSV